MRKSMESFFSSVFSLGVLIAVAGGVVMFAVFFYAIIVGGAEGGKMVVSMQKVYFPYFIKIASIAIFSGAVAMYAANSHALSLKTDKEEVEEVKAKTC